MTAQPLSYPKLLAPRGDGEMLIWPDGRQLLRDTWSNHRNLRETQVRIGTVPLSHLRRWMRRWIGHREDHQPIIATGHQTELYHPGVWVKNAVIASAAERIGAAAIHFAVDTDAPKHLVYRWPGGGRPITDDPNLTKARWSGRLLPPSRPYLTTLTDEAAETCSKWGVKPASDSFFEALANHTGGHASLSEAITNAHNASDRSLGLKVQTVIASQVARTTGFLTFVHDICARADEYVRIYNAALADFRRTHGIESPGRPMPDLSLDDDFCEVPFWLDDLADGERKRASVARVDGKWTLLAGDDAFAFDPAATDTWQAAEQLGSWLSRSHLRLSPRALTLTSFLRLAVVDQFVHGIGGAIYDQVTDRLLQNWYGLEPPAFSVGTVTLYFPAAIGRERTCVECIAREGRKLRDSALGERKMQLVAQIAAEPRRSSARAMLFSQMHRELDVAVADDPRVSEHARRYADAREAAAVDKLLFDRELPYTLQTQERLAQVIARVAEAFR